MLYYLLKSFPENLQAFANTVFLRNFQMFQDSYSKELPLIAASALSLLLSSFNLLSDNIGYYQVNTIPS